MFLIVWRTLSGIGGPASAIPGHITIPDIAKPARIFCATIHQTPCKILYDSKTSYHLIQNFGMFPINSTETVSFHLAAMLNPDNPPLYVKFLS